MKTTVWGPRAGITLQCLLMLVDDDDVNTCDDQGNYADRRGGRLSRDGEAMWACVHVYTHKSRQSIVKCCACYHGYHTCSLTDITLAWACVYVSRGERMAKDRQSMLGYKTTQRDRKENMPTHMFACVNTNRDKHNVIVHIAFFGS